MKKEERQTVFEKFGGKCAYCGCNLPKCWHVDHIEAKFRGTNDADMERYNLKRGEDSAANYSPACPRCNISKGTLTIEQFRKAVSENIMMLREYSRKYRMAIDYGLISETNNSVTFYFERTPNS